MQMGKGEIGTMKLRSKYFRKGYPVQLTYSTLKTKITWDENGIADVPSNIARKLLDKNEFGDGYELYFPEEKSLKEEKKTSTPERRALKAALTETPKEELKEESEFLNTIKG